MIIYRMERKRRYSKTSGKLHKERYFDRWICYTHYGAWQCK